MIRVRGQGQNKYCVPRFVEKRRGAGEINFSFATLRVILKWKQKLKELLKYGHPLAATHLLNFLDEYRHTLRHEIIRAAEKIEAKGAEVG